MQKTYNLYYKEVGNRRLQNLLNPIVTPFPGFSRNALFHYYTNDDSFEIDISNPFFKEYDLRIQTDYAATYTSPEGNPRRTSKLVSNEVRPFHVKNKKFQYKVDAVKTTGNQQQLVVYSYNQLKELYLYPKTPMVSYYKWWNLNKTVFDTIEEMRPTTLRYHNVFMEVPKVLPARSMLDIFKSRTTPAMLKVFDTPGKLMMLELWKWVDPSYRDKSIFAKLSVDTFPLVNILFKLPDGQYSVLNLGYLNSWIKGQPNQTEFNAVSTQKFDIIQKLFLAYMMRLVSSATPEEVAVVDDPAATPEEEPPETTEDQDSGNVEEEEEVGVEGVEGAKKEEEKHVTDLFGKSKTSDTPEELEKDDNRALEKLTINFDKAIDDIDKDLSVLEVIAKKTLSQKGLKIEGTEITDAQETDDVDAISVEELQALVYTDIGVEASVLAHLDEAAELGKISASDYRKMANQVMTRKQSKDPFGSNKTLEEASVITPEDLKLDPEKVKIVASSVVSDPSMLESSLQSMDYDYITKTYKKDVLNMIDSLQRSGVIVQKHSVEESHTALGSFETHSLEIKPIDGQASTLRFKLPIIEDDGTLVVATTKYVLRKQRVD